MGINMLQDMQGRVGSSFHQPFGYFHSFGYPGTTAYQYTQEEIKPETKKPEPEAEHFIQF
jgi:hypothetical protein